MLINRNASEMKFNSKKTRELKREILRISYDAKACHLGSSLSCISILADLFYNKEIKPEQLIFSKASGFAALLVILVDKGIIPRDRASFYLAQYPEVSKEVPGVIWSGGSVGHGLAVGTGLAFSNRKKDIYVLVSDGELQEGVSYESALFARQHKLNNLFVICDDNKLQAIAKTEDVLDLETAFDFYKKTFPNFRRVKTVKGDGVSFLANKVESHYMNLTEELLGQALKELN